MSAGKKIWSVTWRVFLGFILLLWIFHSIFLKEGRLAIERAGGLTAWTSLEKVDQWKAAWSHGPHELWRTIMMIEPWHFAVSILLMGITVVLGVIRWNMVLQVQGLNLPLPRATSISFIAHFFNSFFLGSTGGDLMKAYYAARETHHRKTEAVAAVFMDRIVGLWSMLLFAVVMMLPNFGLLERHPQLLGWTLFILCLLLGSSGFLALALYGGVSRRFPKARDWMRKLPKGQNIERAIEACRVFGSNKAVLFRVIAVSMALNTVCVFQFIAVAYGLKIVVPPTVMFLVVPMIICIAAFPITPSGLGVRESLFVVILSHPSIGVNGTLALSLSLLAYAGSLFWSLVGGLVYMTRRDKEHLEEVTSESEETA